MSCQKAEKVREEDSKCPPGPCGRVKNDSIYYHCCVQTDDNPTTQSQCPPTKLHCNDHFQNTEAPAKSSSQIGRPYPVIIKIPSALGLSAREHKVLHTATICPPVTKKTLSELDLPCIISNINLRTQINFELHLLFKPNLDSEKGKWKRKKTTDYWEAVAVEISVYTFYNSNQLDRTSFNRHGDNGNQGQTFEPRLPEMFKTLQDILKTLVPERDHFIITQNLDVSFIMQQIWKAVLDLVGLANWLITLLKTHCAPMRDEWADEILEQISAGSLSQNSQKIVDGLQSLFALLEAAKLDIANHQIRILRGRLIEDTVPFLRVYFQTKFERGSSFLVPSRLWYQDRKEQKLCTMDKTEAVDDFWHLSIMLEGLMDLLLQLNNPGEFPGTFTFDLNRLWKLRSSLQNLIKLDISWWIFKSLIHAQHQSLSTPTETYATFNSRILSLMGASNDCYGRSPWSSKNLHRVALEIARFACVTCGCKTVSNNVVALIETTLESHVSEYFKYFQNQMRKKLMMVTFAFAKEYQHMSPFAICESQQTSFQKPDTQQHYDIEAIGMQLAHIGILHWRVWATIVYVPEHT